MESGVTRSKRVAIVQAEDSTKVILTEFHVADVPPAMREQLQLTTWGGGAHTHNGYARLTRHQASRLRDALDSWLNGREPAA